MDSFLVLLIDDDPVLQDIVGAILNHHEIRLIVAHNEAETIAHLNEVRPDIILLDILLPGTDGYALLKVIRARVNCPVVATTAYYASDSRVNIEAAGFDAFMPKPIIPQQLVFQLEKILHA